MINLLFVLAVLFITILYDIVTTLVDIPFWRFRNLATNHVLNTNNVTVIDLDLKILIFINKCMLTIFTLYAINH